MRKRAARSIVALLTAFVFLLTITPVAVFTEDAAPGAGTPIITGEQPSGNDVSIFHTDIQFNVTDGSVINDGAAMTITVDGATYTAPLSTGHLGSGFFTCTLTAFSDGAGEPLGLAYDKTYTVSLPAGAFKNADGSASSEAYSWSFTATSARLYEGTISPEVYDKGPDGTVVLTIEDSSWDNLASLSLDSTPLTKDTHYTAENIGPKAVFTLDKGYLDGLDNGKHTLTAEFYDGLFSGEFTIAGNIVYQGTISPETYNVDAGGDATLTVTGANPSDLVSLKVGDATLTTDDYTASTSGSDAVFTLLRDYLKTMEAGSYTIIAEFTNGSCSVDFSVIEDITYVGTVSPEEYDKVSGGTIKLTVDNAASANLISLFLDKKELNSPADFTSEISGENVIYTLKESVLQNLAVGKHSIDVKYDDGACNAGFSVAPRVYTGTVSPEEYDLISGGTVKLTVDNAASANLISLFLDKKELNSPVDFTSEISGENVIYTLKESTLQSLAMGEHSIDVKYDDGACNAGFSVAPRVYTGSVSPEEYDVLLGGTATLTVNGANPSDLVSLKIGDTTLTSDDYTASTSGSDVVYTISEKPLKWIVPGIYDVCAKFKNGTCNVSFSIIKGKTYEASVSPEEYDDLSEKDAKLTVHKASQNKFLYLTIDGKILRPNIDYTVAQSGQNIIYTLNKSYLQTLKQGSHRIYVEFTDGWCDVSYTSFNILPKSKEPVVILYDSELNELGRQPLDGDASFDVDDINPGADYYLLYLMEYTDIKGYIFGYNERNKLYSANGVNSSILKESRYDVTLSPKENSLISPVSFTDITLYNRKIGVAKVSFTSNQPTEDKEFESIVQLKKGSHLLDGTKTTISGTMKGQSEKTTNTFTTEDGLISIETSQQLPASCRLISESVSDKDAAKMLSSLPPGRAGERYANIELVDADGKKVLVGEGSTLIFNVPIEGIKKWRVIASRLNVRSGPGTSYSKIGELYESDIVTGELTDSKAWLKINYNRGVGYVSSQYVKQVIVEDNPPVAPGSGGTGSDTAGAGHLTTPDAGGIGGIVGIPAGADKVTPVGVLHLLENDVVEYKTAETSYNPSTRVVMFKISVNSLSPFMLVYDISETATAATSSSPKTGDDSNVYGYLALCLTAGGAGLVFYRRRRIRTP